MIIDKTFSIISIFLLILCNLNTIMWYTFSLVYRYMVTFHENVRLAYFFGQNSYSYLVNEIHLYYTAIYLAKVPTIGNINRQKCKSY